MHRLQKNNLDFGHCAYCTFHTVTKRMEKKKKKTKHALAGRGLRLNLDLLQTALVP